MGNNNTSSFSRNLLILGGSVATLGSYAAYRSTAPEDEHVINDLIIPTITSALISIPTLLALAMRDRQFAVPFTVAVAIEGAGMLPGADAGKTTDSIKRFGDSVKRKTKQSFEHNKAKLIQMKNHWGEYDDPSDVNKAAEKKIKKMLPPWMRWFLGLAKVEGNTDGDKSTLGLSVAGGPAINLWTSEEPPTPSVQTPSYIDIEDFKKPHVPYFPQAEEAEKKVDESVVNALMTSLRSTSESVLELAVPVAKKAVSGVATAITATERYQDEQFKDQSPTDRVICSGLATALDSGSVAVASTTATVLFKHPGAGVATAAALAVPAKVAGDCLQEVCHAGLNIVKGNNTRF